MSTNEIKHQLHECIENIDDNKLLMTVKDLLEHKYTPVVIPKLNKTQKKRIDESIDQIKRGEYLTDEDADKIVDKWRKG